MKIQIENVSVASHKPSAIDWRRYVEAVSGLEVGQSFLIENPQSNHRTAISVAQIIQGKMFVIRKEKGKVFRVGRTA